MMLVEIAADCLIEDGARARAGSIEPIVIAIDAMRSSPALAPQVRELLAFATYLYERGSREAAGAMIEAACFATPALITQAALKQPATPFRGDSRTRRATMFDRPAPLGTIELYSLLAERPSRRRA